MISQLKWWNKVDSISRSVNTASCGGKSWKKSKLSWRSKCWCYNKIQRRDSYIFDMTTFLMSNLFEIVSTVFSLFTHGTNIAPTVFFKYQKCSVSLWAQLRFYIWGDTSLEAYQNYNRAFGTSEAVRAENLAEVSIATESFGQIWSKSLEMF